MYGPAGVRTSLQFPVPDHMKAWVLGDPDQLLLRDKPTPVPGRAEVLVRIDAVAICATDLEIIYGGSPASILGGLPFNKNFTPGHEYMGTIAALGPDVDEFEIGERVSVEIHAGCGQCKRCRQGMYTSCLNYGKPEKGHRAHFHVRPDRTRRARRGGKRCRHWPRPNRAARGSRCQGAWREPGDPDGNPQPPPCHRQGVRGGPRHQYRR